MEYSSHENFRWLIACPLILLWIGGIKLTVFSLLSRWDANPHFVPLYPDGSYSWLSFVYVGFILWFSAGTMLEKIQCA